MSQVADDPLIDMLKELGMDFVADVLQGKVRPTFQQSQILSQGYSEPAPEERGTVLIGGCADGRRTPLQHDCIQMPAAPDIRMSRRWPNVRSAITEIPTDVYHVQYLSVDDWTGRFYMVNSMPPEQAAQRLLDGYQAQQLPYTGPF